MTVSQQPQVVLHVPVEEPRPAVMFYRRLGFQPGITPTLLTDVNGRALRIVPAKGDDPQRFTFYVRSLKYLKRQLERTGTPVLGPIEGLVGRYTGLMFRDPDGHLIRCLEKPELMGPEITDAPPPVAGPSTGHTGLTASPSEPHSPGSYPRLNESDYAASKALLKFLRKMQAQIRELQTLMVEFSEGHCEMRDLGAEYTALYRQIEEHFGKLARLGLQYPHKNPHRELTDFLLSWTGDLPTTRVRQNFIVGLYSEIHDELDELIDSLSRRVPPAALFPAIR